MRIHHVLICVAVAIVLGGCAFGQRINYSGSSTFSAPSAKGVAALGAQDERPYVVNGGKDTNYVGMNRSLYGIPYNVHTTSGEPLADELGSLVAGGLRKNGANVTQVRIPIGTSPEGRIALFKPTNASRYHLIEIREWMTDNYFGATISYDVSLSVMDGRGSILATKNTRGSDIKLGSRPDLANLAIAVSTIFGGLINDPAIVAASVGDSVPNPVETSRVPAASGPQSPTEAKAGGCSVDQVLEMKRVGLSEDRIKVACK